MGLTHLAAARWDCSDGGGSDGLRALSEGTVVPARFQGAKQRPLNPEVLASCYKALSKVYGFRERGKVFELTCEAPLAPRETGEVSDHGPRRSGAVGPVP